MERGLDLKPRDTIINSNVKQKRFFCKLAATPFFKSQRVFRARGSEGADSVLKFFG